MVPGKIPEFLDSAETHPIWASAWRARRNPPGWWSYHLFTTWKWDSADGEWGHSRGPPLLALTPCGHDRTGNRDWVMILQSLSVKVGSNQRWSEGALPPGCDSKGTHRKRPRNHQGGFLGGSALWVGRSTAATETLTEGSWESPGVFGRCISLRAGLDLRSSFVQWHWQADLCQGRQLSEEVGMLLPQRAGCLTIHRQPPGAGHHSCTLCLWGTSWVNSLHWSLLGWGWMAAPRDSWGCPEEGMELCSVCLHHPLGLLGWCSQVRSQRETHRSVKGSAWSVCICFPLVWGLGCCCWEGAI